MPFFLNEAKSLAWAATAAGEGVLMFCTSASQKVLKDTIPPDLLSRTEQKELTTKEDESWRIYNIPLREKVKRKKAKKSKKCTTSAQIYIYVDNSHSYPNTLHRNKQVLQRKPKPAPGKYRSKHTIA